MRLALCIFSIIVACSIGTGIYAATKRAEVIRKVAQSTVVVNSEARNSYSQGSGTVIGVYNDFVFILTCHHVIEGSIAIKVFPTGKPRHAVPATIEVDSPGNDLALLVAALDLPALPLATKSPELYDTVYLVGAPAGEAGTASEGMVTDLTYRFLDRTWWRVTNGVIMAGISGGTATNADGQLIGVPARGSKATSQQGLLIPLSYINEIARGYVHASQ